MDPKTVQDIFVIIYGVGLMAGCTYYLCGGDDHKERTAPARRDPSREPAPQDKRPR